MKGSLEIIGLSSFSKTNANESVPEAATWKGPYQYRHKSTRTDTIVISRSKHRNMYEKETWLIISKY